MEKLLAELKEKYQGNEEGGIYQLVSTADKMAELVELVNRHLGPTPAEFPPYFWSVGNEPLVMLVQEGTMITLTII